MANEHPFQMLFETLGRLPVAHADSVNRRAYEILYDILSVPVETSGRCILLRAPRAGHGKTHLLSRIQHHLGASHEFIPMHAAFGCQIDAASVIDDTMRRLLRPLPASGGLCVLDLVTRRLFATALQPLVSSGEVPCQDREGALAALRARPIETFDFHHPNAVTAHWARENFEVLGQRLSMELSQRCGLPVREVAFWVDALFRFAATSVENPVRLRALADAIHGSNPSEGVLTERLVALLGLLALLMRVVLVADDLEGFSTDESAALRLAAFLGSLRQSVERLDVILSLNQDIWESAFVPRLSGGLADRLSEVVIELNPLSEDEMVALLESRVPGLGARVLAHVDRDEAGTHARGLVRAAGVAWLRATATDGQPSVPTVPITATPTADVSDGVNKEIPGGRIDVESIAESVVSPSGELPEVSPAPQPQVYDETAFSIASDQIAATEVPSIAAEAARSAAALAAQAASAPVGTSESVPPTSSYGTAQVASIQPTQESVTASASQPASQLAPEPSQKSPATQPSAAAPDTDRVDDLLRQFRERYGRGSM